MRERKKKMKKIISLLVLLVCAFAFIGCKEKEPAEEKDNADGCASEKWNSGAMKILKMRPIYGRRLSGTNFTA